MPIYSSTPSQSVLTKMSVDALGQTSAPGSTAEVILPGCQFLLPANTLAVGKRLSLYVAGAKTGATVAAQLRLRIGTTGTLTDQATNNGYAPDITNTSLSFAAPIDFRVVTATSLRRIGSGGPGVLNSRTGQSTTARPAADTIPNISNALYVTLTCAMAAGTPEWVIINEFEIEVS